MKGDILRPTIYLSGLKSEQELEASVSVCL